MFDNKGLEDRLIISDCSKDPRVFSSGFVLGGLKTYIGFRLPSFAATAICALFKVVLPQKEIDTIVEEMNALLDDVRSIC